jgi:hypothetical protein
MALRAAGLDFHIFSPEGTTLFLVIGAPVLGVVARMERRPLSEYGLVADEGWARRFCFGFLAGTLSCASYLLLLGTTGALLVREHGLESMPWLAPIWLLPTALLSGCYLMLLFCGFIQGTLRRVWGSFRAGGVLAAALTAVLFGLFAKPDAPWQMLAAESLPRFIGLFLAALFLGMLRLIDGSILLPGAVMAGYAFVERCNVAVGFLRRPGDPALLNLLAPDSEPLRSPVMWGALSVAVLFGAGILRRRGEAAVDSRVAAPESLRRLCPFVMFSLDAPLDVWLGRLIQARFDVPLSLLPRLLFSLACSTLATIVCLPERLLLPPLLRNRKVPGPLFVIGVHRSGTTHLHNLLSLDKQFVPARMFQVLNPTGYLVCGWVLALPVAAFMPWRRPHDSMSLSFWSPQEEEFAVVNSCGERGRVCSFHYSWEREDRN